MSRFAVGSFSISIATSEAVMSVRCTVANARPVGVSPLG